MHSVFFCINIHIVHLQAMCLKYLHPDSELQNYALPVMDMLRSDTDVDAQALVSDVNSCIFG